MPLILYVNKTHIGALSTVESLLYDHHKRDGRSGGIHIVCVAQCPSHEIWSYKRDGRWRGWSFVRGSTVLV